MKKYLLVIVLLILVFSCDKKNKPPKPNNLISKEQMEDILYDLYVINAAKGVNRKLLEDNGVVPESYILNKHLIDSVQFAESNAYYAFDPDLYKEMVEKVKVRLENKKTSIEALEEKESKKAQKRRDSITKLNEKRRDSIKKALKAQVSN
ncbi:hypothetical protein BWZ20_07350 [Winogradskyella sp. J14-2]|uniref:DUF4296 domain-containing protein n=1 Tax=Winogradskyella sp. J14-2 TaxID=1936080 RepID=UPI000972AE78|nr:DUF4296 domain-containing protein [Winogradskyella sp. J14-2]APY08125.1 hypothetical protein BWZ20_07350 [Winogradskyella sp. J14-2]